ncbi:hypothetical protein SDC9_186653 [bioreactor metagenome]|uniref:Uncharacterized protein n=1 Tax=bioreactor metagenome TaxID=1076179 RepID=A0A645HKJ4_9ZZZZ
MVEDDFGVEAGGVLLETLHQFRSLHAVGVGRPVVDFGGGHQLAPLGHAGDQHRFEVGACGVNGGGVAGRAGTENDQWGVTGCHLGLCLGMEWRKL